jgi:hypothetical protein
MLQMNVLKLFWVDAVLTATYLLNRTFSHILKGKSPFEMFPGKYPFSVPSKVFGCVSLFSYERKITRIYILYPYSPYIYSYCSFDSTRSHCSSYLSGLCSRRNQDVPLVPPPTPIESSLLLPLSTLTSANPPPPQFTSDLGS